MKILVDADACPAKHIIEEVASDNGIAVTMYCDMNHVLGSNYSTIKYVDSGFQSVDMVLIGEVGAHDIVVSQDYGVAAMALGKKAYAVSPRGYIYDDKNIDKLLFERHISSKVRRRGGKTPNPKKRTLEDDKRLEKSLERLISMKKNL
ncbi:MAG: YaiI/YqxD family protein [Clostridium sp.]|jgi:uncharacterized protein YaiI (UPF0178 family)|uniref:YaiI/YqxD family protein n=1 Tax=Clostridium sp. TaxID=1506 RepID=UPI0025C42845|nr:YaiI/YqxD family protein [Clostridium sp.]MCH3962735.1 YaiI/YqxD family protein [Clostridium sp.]MCI1715850.1 YaiI/YqxD family protein [Clostridium sp.]MCI1799945.1 YaiI/YqxD family protein [Clostridium sp.]MCI1813859.1 YaiI/YqxD family protein [Clostridium sp.]MCI1870757.1 YaiI/YqxD family protein [Clostridium sp.]